MQIHKPRDWTPEKALAFAIAFATCNLHEQSRGDWLNWREGMDHFLWRSLVVDLDAPEQGMSPDEAPQEDYVRTHDEAQALFRDLVHTRDQDGGFAAQFGFRVVVNVFAATLRIPENDLCANGSLRDLFFWRLNNLLAQQPLWARVKACPECGGIFLQRRRQRYCSRSCVNRANIRRWRQSPKGQRYERQRAKQRKRSKHQPVAQAQAAASGGEKC
jgi:hypothetical protein